RITHHENRMDKVPAIIGFALRNADGSRQPSVGAEPTVARAFVEPFLPRSRRKYKAVWRTKPGSVDWVTGACVLIDCELLNAQGGMDEDFFLYYEEAAMCRVARDLGKGVEYDPAVEVVHLWPLQNRAITPALRVITRHSRLLYFRKHKSSRQFQAMARM